MNKIYIPKSSTCLWVMIGFFFVYRYIFSVIDFNDVVGSLNNNTGLVMILMIMIIHPFLFNHPAMEKEKISVLHYLNIFMILKDVADIILTFLFIELVCIIKAFNDFIDKN